MMRIKSMMTALLLLLLCSWRADEYSTITITGTITDARDGSALPGVSILIKGSSQGTVSEMDGSYQLEVPSEKTILVYSFIGYQNQEIKVGSRQKIDVKLKQAVEALSEVVVSSGQGKMERKIVNGVVSEMAIAHSPAFVRQPDVFHEPHNTEEYASIHENGFREALTTPLSTFSIDVDKASYSNVRRFINGGQLPPKDAVRIEEMINYFTYDYPQPEGNDPFSVTTELSDCPWNKAHRLLHIGLQGKKISTEKLPPSNLVFLIDVSGSMNTPQGLPLVKSAFKLLVNELRPQDKVSIVVYAGAAGMVLPPTAGNDKASMLEAIERLQAGGSTAGGAGIKLAYAIAEENFVKGGNNRVILATDGDFNVGVSSNAAMERLVEEKRNSGVFLTVLGFGMGNYKDSKMELMADKGNGNYAYIDNLLEAQKVFVHEFGGTLFTIAKDVKLQLEFNPARVKGYRLIGYENRLLNKEDFNDDRKDAGELGSGHTVTALYEIIPAGAKESPFLQLVDPLKYQQPAKPGPAVKSDEMLTIKLRYKQPQGTESHLLQTVVAEEPLALEKSSDNFRFSAAVAAFGMLLRDSEFKGSASYPQVLAMAQAAKGKDEEGYRAEFIRLVKSMQLVAQR